MKASVLGLLIAAGAFGASTLYLAVQLEAERDRADQVAEQWRALSARIAELEKARDELEYLRSTGGPEPGAELDQSGGESKADAAPVSALASASRPAEVGQLPAIAAGGLPERSQAMQKMMRAQLRHSFRRLHADVGDQLGLTKEDANRLIDLMIDQQISQLERGRQERGSNLTPEQRATAWSAQQEKNLAEVAALIGADRIEAYKAYQDTLPARQEVDVLSRQLEASDLALSTSQRSLLVAALAEERRRIPMPKFSDSGSREDYNQALAAWQDDYNQRAATRASSILNGDQQATYTEYQEWNREMRQQFEARRAARNGNQE